MFAVKRFSYLEMSVKGSFSVLQSDNNNKENKKKAY